VLSGGECLTSEYSWSLTYIYEKKAKEIIREPVAFYMDQLKERDV
jgi:hypothetical protein